MAHKYARPLSLLVGGTVVLVALVLLFMRGKSSKVVSQSVAPAPFTKSSGVALKQRVEIPLEEHGLHQVSRNSANSVTRLSELLARKIKAPAPAPGEGLHPGREPRPIEVEPMLPPEASIPVPRDFSPLSERFTESLMRASAANGKDPERACLEWSRLGEHLLAPSASKHERELGYFNIAAACTRHQDHPTAELRLAREATFRYAELSGDRSKRAPLSVFEDKFNFKEKGRYQLVWIAKHEPGTKVVIDGEVACIEPCTLAIPLDRAPHRLGFLGESGSASVQWRSDAKQVMDPKLPALR